MNRQRVHKHLMYLEHAKAQQSLIEVSILTRGMLREK